MEMAHNRLVFNEPVTSLQRICAFRTALHLWTSKIQHGDWIQGTNTAASSFDPSNSHKKKDENLLLKPICCNEMAEMIGVLQLPDHLAKMIDNFVCTVIKEVETWCHYHASWRIYSNARIMTEERLNLIVWRPDASIDYEKTAHELVRNGGLDQPQMVDLFCEYFMVDELRENRKFWFQIQEKHNQIFAGKMFLNYIILQDVPDYSPDYVINFLLDYGHLKLHSGNFTPIKFALDHIPTDSRVSFGVQLITKQRQSDHSLTNFAKFLISEYTASEQWRLLASIDVFVILMRIFISQQGHLDFAMRTWLYIRNLVDGLQFIAMFEMIQFQRATYNSRIDEFVSELWNSSPIYLKEFVYSLPEDDDFLFRLCIRPPYLKPESGFCRREDGLLIKILADADSKFRQVLWYRYWSFIIDRSKPSALRTIVTLCISTDELEVFKNALLSSDATRQYFTDLIAHGYCSDLNEIFGLFACGEKRDVDVLKGRLLESISDLSSIVRHCGQTLESVNALGNFLVDGFRENLHGLIQFMVNMIWTSLTSPAGCAEYHLTKMFSLLEHLCDQRVLAKVKEEILIQYKVVASHPQWLDYLSLAEWPMLLVWCLETKANADEFYRLLYTY